jgi:hypothetical protein
VRKGGIVATASNEQVRFDGRILFLSENADMVERQLHGADISLADALPLRSDVSTDEITPAAICYYYDEKLGDYPYHGLKCGQRLPVFGGQRQGWRIRCDGGWTPPQGLFARGQPLCRVVRRHPAGDCGKF